MRKNIIISFMALAISIGFSACDDVKEGDRYIDLGKVEAKRNVLLEDFTGQFCLNCPDAHEIIHKLEAQPEYEDKIVAVSIHCMEGLGFSKEYTDFPSGTVGLMTEEGNEIFSGYGITALPMGVINGGQPESMFSWAASVRTALSQSTDVTIEARAKFTPNEAGAGEDLGNGLTLRDGNTGTITITADIMSGINRTADVHFWIVESGIVAPQRQPDGKFKNDYVHDNVFRAWVLGSKGKSVTFPEGITQTVTGSIECRYNDQERWVPENLDVVVFVSDGGVLQVEKVEITAE